ncbi:DUF7666 domain-containing protein [Lachnoclostridium phytofermentans]|uniref:DUF7666 domain-containing protein n=1 Tax=Lachnoclostridium phytofermentans TaxID=66219 RepID=UPI0003041919|nr:hypothetical protein [Lachnoclostridium phytofermentans]
MSETTKCYRFVKDDMTSENGSFSWEIGEWNQVSGELVCCSNGLHAAQRDSCDSSSKVCCVVCYGLPKILREQLSRR